MTFCTPLDSTDSTDATPQRFEETYFPYNGYYLTGDGARRDEDGDYWITGRVDDVVIVSGHNIGTAEVESAVVLHPSVAEVRTSWGASTC